MARPTRAVIDLTALAHNARLIRSLAKSRRVMAAVKANAYGHGVLSCARVLAPHVDALAVAFLDEAHTLREAGIDLPVLVLEGPMSRDEIGDFRQLDLWPVVHRAEQLRWLEQAAGGWPGQLWLKVDTGMHRLGLDIAELPAAIERAQKLAPNRVTLMSHLALASEPEHALSQRQLARWQGIIDAVDMPTSLLNSAAMLQTLDDSAHWVRPGYLFYGGVPDNLSTSLDLQPVMRLESAVIAVRQIAVDENVGYGGRWRAVRDSRIATIPIGYADGYPRSARDGTPVKVGSAIVPLAGRVSMDMITVDITDHPSADVGTPVLLWGATPTIDQVADMADTIGYELTTRITQRVPRCEIAAHDRA